MIAKPFDNRVCADDRRVGDVVRGRVVVALPFPSKIGSAQFEMRRRVDVKPE